MKRPLQPICVGAIEARGNSGQRRRDVEDDACLLVGERVLADGLFTECVVPDETYTDVVLVDGEAQVEEFELAVVPI